MALPFEDEVRQRLGPALFRYLMGRAGGQGPEAPDPNEQAFRRITLVPRVMTGSVEVDVATSVLGMAVAAPLAVGAYAADTVFSPGGLLPMAAVLRRLRLPMLVSEETVTPLRELTGAHDLCWLQLRAAGPVARVCDLAGRAAEAGVRALVLTVLAPVHPRPGLQPGGFDIGAELRARGWPTIGSAGPGVQPLPAFPQWGWRDVSAVAAVCVGAGLPLLVKGVLHPGDAALAEAAGAAGIIVSNVGLRQLDRWPAALDQLPAVRAAAAPATAVLLDGGVRSGLDVLVASALGAAMAVSTRPAVAALASGGPERLETMLRGWVDEMEAACAWMGAARPGALSPDQVRRG